MIAAPVITAGLRVPIFQYVAKWEPLNTVVLGLTPVGRWEAAKSFSGDFMTERWFTITMVVVIIVLTVLLFIVSYNRKLPEQKAANQLFDEYANKSGLSERERQIVQAMAGYAGLKESEAIFTMGNAFDRGAAKMVEESFAWRGSEGSRLLQIELSYLREKLGLQKQHPSSIGSTTKPKKLSSRQIPVGRKVYITRRTTRFSDEIEAMVVENDDIELTLKLTIPVKITFGEAWRVHYYFGASVWEFDTSMVSYDGDILVLNHSDNVRFINRRRFLRVPVNKPAFIARFPFARTLAESSDSNKADPKVKQNSANASNSAWGLPEFTPAVITELAGPGLRIEVPLEVKVGNRVLVVFKLDDGKDRDSVPVRRDGKVPASKIVQDIGEVRHIKAIQNGFSIAVELTGLSDLDVDELVRATNAASLRGSTAVQDMQDSVNTEEHVPEPSAVQGV